MEENIQSKHFPTGGREIFYGLGMLLLSLLAVDFLFYGGLNLGFALAALGLTAVTWFYLKPRISGYTGALLILECIILTSFIRSDDAMVKFVMLMFALVAGNLSLMLASGKNQHQPGGFRSLLDGPRAVVTLGLGDLDKSLGGLNDARKNAGTLGKKNLAILSGLAVAVPVLAVLIPLLMQADAAFEGLLNLLPRMDFSELLIVLMFGIPTGCVVYTRNTSLKHKPTADRPEKAAKTVHSMTVTTVLILVAVLYLVYLFSQLAYFAGGLSGILPEEYTLAQYARRGFFEMAWLSGINLAIIALAVGLAEKKEGKTPLPIKLLCLFIALMTLFFVAVASGKMVLYIASFGLTRLRVLTQVVMVFIGITVVYVTMWLFMPRFAYMKAVVITALVIGAAVAWADVDTVVAVYNVRAYQSGALEKVDIVYLCSLGDSAVPYIQELTADDDFAVSNTATQELIHRADRESSDLRSWNIVSARANAILSEYEPFVKDIQDREFSFSVFQDQTLDELGCQYYSNVELTSIVAFRGSLKELIQVYPMECVRMQGENYRLVYRSSDRVAVIVFDWNLNILSRDIYDLWGVKADLMEIGPGCTMDYVGEIVPSMYIHDGYYSDHFTVDGWWFHIEYKHNLDGTATVVSVDVELL